MSEHADREDLYCSDTVNMKGLYGSVFVKEYPEGVFLTITLSPAFLSKFNEFSIDSYGGVRLVASQDIFSPSFTCDKDKDHAITMVLCSTIEEQKVKLETTSVIDFMFVKEFLDNIAYFFGILNSHME